MDKNSFYRSELRALFVKYNVEPNVELIDFLAQLVGSKDRAANGAYEAVNDLASIFNVEDPRHPDLTDISELQRRVYGIVWQQSLEK